VVILLPGLVNGIEYLEKTLISVSKIPDDLLLSELKSLVVDRNGNVFALDVKGCFVVKFSSDLEYITHFGRNGKGPSEFNTKYVQNDDRLSVDENGDVYIDDYNPDRLLIFDNNGKYKKEINMQRDYQKFFSHISSLRVISNGYFTGKMYNNDSTIDAIIFKLDPPEFKLKIPIREEIINVKHDNIAVFGITDSYYGDNYAIAIDGDRIGFADSQRYHFQVYSNEGEKILEVEEPNRFMGHFSKKELKDISGNFKQIKNNYPELLKKLLNQLKNRKNVITTIKLSGENIFVFCVSDDITVRDRYPVIIYNYKGNIIKRTFFRKIPIVIWKNFVYYVDSDENDSPVIQKFQLKEIK
jgi:hypothetical protein